MFSTYGNCISVSANSSTSAALNGGAPSKWAKAKVEDALKNNFIPESIQGDYQKKITRGEFVSLLVQMIFSYQWVRQTNHVFRLEDDVDFYWEDTLVTRENVLKQVKVLDFNFTDTRSEDVKLAFILGLIKMTSNRKFEPNKLITKQDIAVMLSEYGTPELRDFNKDDFNIYNKRFTDLNKAAPEARDAVKMAFRRYIIGGSATEADRAFESKKKITLDPLGTLTREQAIVLLYNIFLSVDLELAIFPFNFKEIYLKGLLPYLGDCMGINWEVSNNSVKAVSVSDRLKEQMLDGNTTSRRLEYNRNYISEGQAMKISCGAQIATVPRLGAGEQFMTEDQLEMVSKGKNVAFDIGFAVFEANNPKYIFEFRFKNNGFYSANYYGGGKLLPVKSVQIK